MVEMEAVYEGQLHCRVTHGPSRSVITTDAPTDHQGQGAAFSPTDLVGAALGSCMLTVMGIVAKRHGWDLTGTRAHVTKEMTITPPRQIARLAATITFTRPFEQSVREVLERTALTCPVHHSLRPDIAAPVQFVYPE